MLGVQPDGLTALIRTSSTSGVITVLQLTNPADQIKWLQSAWNQPQAAPPDPAWEALRALGPKAVPHLVRQLRFPLWERPYERVVTNLPPVVQRRLPSPSKTRTGRYQAIEAIGRLGDAASNAAPALLELLEQRDPRLRFRVVRTLRNVHADRRSINAALMRLAAQRRYTDVLDIAQQLGWGGREMVRLLGTILQSPDTAMRQNAMTLLEHAGRDARPALEQITVALSDQDGEVRYLAARSLENIGDDSPPVTKALQSSLEDTDVKVRNVARRTLLKIAPETAVSGQPVQPGNDSIPTPASTDTNLRR